VNLVFTTRRLGFAATSGGLRDVPRTGWVLPSEPGEIERTRDGGSTWRTLWRGPLSFDALAVRGRLVVAAGMRARETGRRDPWFTPSQRHVLLVSRDGGRRWARRRLPIRGTVALQLLTPRVWLALRADPLTPSAKLVRSDDAGRHWRTVTLPAGAQTVRFGSPLVGVANARATSCPRGRRMQLWRTVDGGQTWRPLAGTCAASSSAADVDFVTPRLAFAVQAGDYGWAAPGVLRRSEDGGATWTTIARDRKHAASLVRFSDRRHGVLVESLDLPRLQGAAMLLASTADGGRTWARHPLPAEVVNTAAGTPMSPAATLGRDVWVGHTRAGVIWHTGDGGRRWALTTAPRFLDAGSDSQTPPLLAGAQTLLVSSAAGPVQSGDGGQTWAPVRWPSDRDAARIQGRGAYLDEQDRARLVTGSPLTPPSGVRRISEVAFSNARDGVLAGGHGDYDDTVYATHDGGATWSVVPSRRHREPSFALAPGVVVDTGDATVAVTTDEGASWQTLERNLTYPWCQPSRPGPLDIWIACAGSGKRRTLLFKSADGGRTWTRRVTARELDPRLAVTGAAEAWATDLSTYPGGDATSTLWHTTDAGATWTQTWVSLPPRAPALQIDCAVIPSGVDHAPLSGCR
jgi:photosystem II stability/assembly factor-like uncharacterized protein